MPDLDGLLRLHSAELEEARTTAQLAGQAAETAQKWMQVELTKQQVVSAKLDNLAKYLKIRWDAQAHDNLIRIRNQALQKARKCEDQVKNAEKHFKRLNAVIFGGTWEEVRNGWLAFHFFSSNAPAGALLKSIPKEIPAEAFELSAWNVVGQRQPTACRQKDWQGMCTWASISVLYPSSSGAAWPIFSLFLENLALASDIYSTRILTESQTARKEALEIAKIDWGRLDK